MRSRRTTFSTSIDLSKPVEKLVDELSSNLDPNNSSNTQLDRIESVKNFLIRFKFHFNQAPSQQQQQTALNRILVNEIDESSSIAYNVAPKSTKNVDQQFEAALEEKCESISIGLVYSIIQSESTQLRLLALQTILYLSHFRSFALRFHQLNTNLYVVRLIDLDLSWDETSLCFEYIRLLTQLWPSHLDKAIVYCLLSALEDAKYKLNYLILETLLEIVCRRPSLACECSVFNELITYVLNASNENEFIIELVMQTLVRACDDERIRCQIPIYNIFSNLIAPLIDTAYVPFTYGSSYAQHTTRNAAPTTTNNNPYSSFIDSGSSEGGEPKFESVVTCAFTALGSLMSTYTGVMCFLINDGRLVYDLLAPLSWYLNANKRDADKRQALAEQVTAGSADTSNNAPPPPLQNTNQAAPDGNNTSRKNSDPKELMAKQKELFILNGFISFFYKLFSIEEISTKKLIAKAFRCMGRSLSVGSSSQHQQQYMSFYDLTEEDFVNNECEALFDSFENYSAQSNMNNLEASAYTSTSPNLTICHRIFLLKTFIEARLLESLLDLYFGLPVSFLENSSLFSSSSSSNLQPSNNLLAQYELLSLKCLHLFSELYYMGNRLLHNEYCIDDLDPNTTKCPFTANSKSIYNEMKKLSLIGYLRQLNYLEREKEVLIYVTDLNTKKESIRRGEMLPSDEIVHMSFFAQQFLANSGHLSSKKFHQELEMLNSTLSISPQNNKTRGQGNTGAMNEPYLQNIFHMVSNVFATSGEESAQTRERKEIKTRLAEIEKKIDEQLDSTQILTADLNISSSANTNNTSWNWLEIIKLFELFLLEHSSFYPRFEPSRDAEFLRKHKRKLFSADSQKLVKVIKKLLDFFSLTSSDSTSSGGLSSSPGHSHLGVNVASNQLSYSPRVSSHFHMPRLSQGIIIPPPALQQQGGPNNLSDQISCVGCYLIDFCLDEIEIANIAQNQFSSIIEFLFVQLLQSIRQYLLNEYPLNAQQQLHQSSSFLAVNHAQTTQLHHSLNSRASMMSTMSSRSAGGGKDSILANYLLFLGHMSANPKGDLLLEHFKIYDLMVKIVEIHRDHSFIKLATSTLNYYTSPKSRLVLERALCSRVPQSVKSGYNDLKIYMIKLVLNLFRAHNLKFDSFFLRILIRSMSFALDDEETSPLVRFSNEQVLELIISAVEYVVNLRPDLLDRLLDKDDELVRSVDELIFKCSAGATKSRLIRARLEFLSVRLKLSESKLAKMSKQQLENMVKSWYNMKKDLKHMKLVERSLFDANSLNSLYMSEIDDRIDDPVYDTVQPMSSLSYTPVTNFSLDESSPSPLTRSRSNTASNAAQLQPSVKLYRRINDPNRNFTRFQTSLAQIYMPFHINTAIVRHAGFVANNFTLDEFFDEKTVEQLEIIKAASFGGHTQKVSRARLKTALWSISSLCICENGFRMLSRVSQSHGVFGNLFELACCFVKLAEECTWLSIRATCFICSNLVCKSSTGANLWGKLGWHTFQSNLFTPTRAFHSTVASLSAEQQDLSVASSIDIAVVIYNLNRAKLNRLGLTMKSIQKYYFYEFSDYELRFLNEISRTDLASKKDSELIREYNHSEEIGTGGGIYFAENLTVPIRMTLLSPEDDFKKMTSILSHQEQQQQQQHQNDNEAEFDCKSTNCFYCCYLLKSDEGKTSSAGDEERRKMAHDFITKLMFILNVDKSKMKKLISLRKFHPSVFNFCFYYLISTKYLSCYRLKFHVRKSIQELFFDVFKSFVENSRS